MRHTAFGLHIDSELPLPIPTTVDGVPPDLVVRTGAIDEQGVVFAPRRDDDGGDGARAWMDEGWGRGRVVLDFHDTRAELAFGEPTVVIDPGPDDDDGHVAHLVLDHVIPRWLALQGDLVLHAGAAVSPRLGAAIAFIGETGRGKSTTVAGLASEGWPLLGDDGCRITRPEGVHHAWPSYAGVRLLPASRRALAPGVPSTPMALGAEKHRLLLDQDFETRPAPLRLVVELGDDAPEAAVVPMSLSSATAALVRHSFYLAPSPDRVAAQAFELASDLAMSVPCVRLDFPRRFDVYPELVDLLAGVLAQP